MKRNTVLVLVVSTIAAIPTLLIMVVVGRLLWAKIGPFRPTSVRKDAVFLRGPEVGFPGLPQGEWLACWESNGEDRCRLSAKDGTTEFEGVFVPYGGRRPVPDDQLSIDAWRTRHADPNSFWLNNTWVPFVYLKNGDVLIPASQYEKGVLLLDRKRTKVR